VAAKLGLTEEQLDQIREIHESMRPPMPPRDGQAGPPSRDQMEQMRQKMEQMRAEITQKVLGILTPEQRQKWNALTGKPFKLDGQRG
jgi:Spy/CpxP family protein refolding chaperone